MAVVERESVFWLEVKHNGRVPAPYDEGWFDVEDMSPRKFEDYEFLASEELAREFIAKHPGRLFLVATFPEED